MKTISAKELKQRMDAPQGVTILDVRASTAYDDWRIQGQNVNSLNIQNSKLKEFGVASFTQIPRDREVVAVCAKGAAAQETVEMLEAVGYQGVLLEGGMEAWSEFYEPVPVVQDDHVAVYQILRRAKGCLSYLVTSGGEAVVVDAGRQIGNYIEFADHLGVQIRHVFDSHLHADHISGGRALAAAVGADYWLAPAEAEGGTFEFHPLADGQSVSFGTATVRFVGLLTPGHTVASTSFLIDDKYLLSGDTLFVSGLGRPDLKGRAAEMAGMMFHTVQTTVAQFDEDVLVLPGHFGDISEIGAAGYVGAPMKDIRANNPLLHVTEENVFVQQMLANLGATPPNHDTIIAINRGQKVVDSAEQSTLEVGPNRCAVTHRA